MFLKLFMGSDSMLVSVHMSLVYITILAFIVARFLRPYWHLQDVAGMVFIFLALSLPWTKGAGKTIKKVSLVGWIFFLIGWVFFMLGFSEFLLGLLLIPAMILAVFCYVLTRKI